MAPADADEARATTIGLRTARAVVGTIVVTTCAIAFVGVARSDLPLPAVAAAVPLLTAVAAIHLWFSRTGRRAYALLAVQAVLAVAPLPYYGAAWAAVPSLSSAALLVLGTRWSVALGVGSMAGMLVYIDLADLPYPLALSAASTTVMVLQAYGLTRLARLLVDLRQTDEALAEAAMWTERTRLAADLRSLLSTSLATVGRTAGDARRLLAEGSPGAPRELDGMVAVARTALAGMRSLARDYRVHDLDLDHTVVDARGHRPAHTAVDQVPWRAVRFAAWLLQAVVGLWLTAWILSAIGLAGLSAAAAVTIAGGIFCAALQLGYLSRVMPPRRPWSFVALGAQAAAVFVPLLLFDLWGLNPRGVLAGSCLLVLRPVPGVAAFGAILVVDAVVRLQGPVSLVDALTGISGTLIVGLATFGMTWNVRLTRHLRTLRHRLAAEAAGQERVRIARDLHDLLGLGMSAIALKSELAVRVAASDPRRADAELAEIIEICATARADVDRVAAGTRDLSLPDELHAADTTLTDAGVRVRLEVSSEQPPEPVRALLAVVLREGVTNALRHGAPTECDITVVRHAGRTTLTIVNELADAGPASSGLGLTSLSERVARLGGELTAGPMGSRRFVLSARVPDEREPALV